MNKQLQKGTYCHLLWITLEQIPLCLYMEILFAINVIRSKSLSVNKLFARNTLRMPERDRNSLDSTVLFFVLFLYLFFFNSTI